MITPTWLKRGALIKIVSPAGKIDEKYISLASDWLGEKGFRVEPGKHCTGIYYQYSGTDSERLEDLQSALDDPIVDAIICSRGGYGTIRIIDRLNFTEFLKHPKWVVGFSDITVLHHRIHQLGIKSIHGPMCRMFPDPEEKPSADFLNLIRILSGEKVNYSFPPNNLNRPGKTRGMITGGNLSLIYSLPATPFDIDTTGKILFLEDIGEYLYHIDRMMTSLRLAGKLSSLSGLVIGQFSETKDNDDPFGATLEEIILNAVRDYDFPVCFGFSAGHESPNLPLILGDTYCLDITGEYCLLGPVEKE